MIDLVKIKAAAMAANKNEWKAELNENYARIYMFPDCGDSLRGYCGKENADFIATANPTAVLELIERLEAAELDAARYKFIKQQTEYDSQSVIRTAYGRIMKLQIWSYEDRQYANCISDLSAYVDFVMRIKP